MTKKNPKDYQSLSQQLDEVLAKFQDESLDVNEAIVLYERGESLILELSKQLQVAENTIKKIQIKQKA